MIQVYRQKEEYQTLTGSIYYAVEGTYRGIHYDINRMGNEADVTVSGTGTGTGKVYINVTWPMESYANTNRYKIEASAEADEELGFCVYYKKQGATVNKILSDKKSEICIDADATEVRYAFLVLPGKQINRTVHVKISTMAPAETAEGMLEHNGDMTLLPTLAVVHPVLNGSWTAELEHPIDPEGRWKYIQEENVVKMPSFNGDQLFRIKAKEKQDSGITASLEPIFYDAMDDCFLTDIRPTRKNGQQALDLMTTPNSKYTGTSDITHVSTAYYEMKNLLEAINGDDENSFINRWGGEILFNNYEVIINERVGGDYGVELRYGKNIPKDGMNEEIDTRDVITRIYPKAYNGYTMTDKGYVDSPLINNYPTVKTAVISFDDVKMAADASEDDEENGVIICSTQSELDEALTQRCEEQYAAGLDKPKVTISADMVLLQNTEEYKDYQVLETVSLGDTIHCRHNRLGIVTDARVIEMEYDSIRKKTTSVVIGDFTYNYFNNVSSAVNRIDGAIRPDGSLIAEKIKGFIDGTMAGLRAQASVAKKVGARAILFEDLDEDSPTYGALAMGTKGLEIAEERTSDGRDWDWTTALTGKGLIAGIIVAGLLSDKEGNNYWDLDSGYFTSKYAKIGDWNVNHAKIYGGDPSKGEKVAVMQRPGNNVYVFAAGGTNHSDYSDCPFRVTKNGHLRAKDGRIGNFSMSENGLTSNYEYPEGGDVQKQLQLLKYGFDGRNAIAVRIRNDVGRLVPRLTIDYDGKLLSGNKDIRWTEVENGEISFGYKSNERANLYCSNEGDLTIWADKGIDISCEKFTVNGACYGGQIPIVHSIQDNGDGSISWTYGYIEIENGFVTNWTQ